MMDAVTISIVLPLYNGARYIHETLASLEAQTFTDAEFVVVNDGSTDDSPAMIEQYCSQSQSPVLQRLTLLKRQNSGVAAARNCGIDSASGTWIALIDQDDLWHEEKLARLRAAVNEQPKLAWHYSAFKRFYDDGREVCKRDGSADRITTLASLVDGSLFIPPSAGLIRKDACRAVGGFDASVIPSDDWDFYLKLAERYDVGYVPEYLVKFRSHVTSTAKRQKLKIFNAQREVLLRHEQLLLKDINVRLIRKRMANIEWHLGKEHELAGNKQTARSHFRQAVKLDPRRIKLLSSFLKSYI
jgi:glycosyltransferase involved in cell wall biosynthesis